MVKVSKLNLSFSQALTFFNSVQGKGFISLMLHLPKGLQYHVRDVPMFPFEVIDKGLKRYTGNPVNSHTKRNKILAQKFKLRKERSGNGGDDYSTDNS